MIDHSKRVSQPLRWTRSSRVAVIVASAVLLAGVVVVAVIASTDGPTQRRGCIEVTFASTLGGAVARQCGERARRTCSTPGENPALAAHGALRDACRRARLPYGSG